MKAPLLLAAALLGAGRAAAAGPGESAAAFLLVPPGARPAGSGGAWGGAARGSALSSWYNPADLGRLESGEVEAGRESLFEGLRYDYAAAAVPLLSFGGSPRPRGAAGSLAFSVLSLSAPGLERRGLVETDEPTGTFLASERAYGLAYGLSPGGAEGAAGGAGLKLVESSLDASRASALSGDLGASWRGGAWSAGAGARSFFGTLSLGSGNDSLPRTYFAGGAWRPAAGLILCGELRFPAAVPEPALGAEWEREAAPGLRAALRAGYDRARAGAGFPAGLSAGLGLSWGRAEASLAWKPGGPLGDSFVYGVGARF